MMPMLASTKTEVPSAVSVQVVGSYVPGDGCPLHVTNYLLYYLYYCKIPMPIGYRIEYDGC